jgi:hypothetical protein
MFSELIQNKNKISTNLYMRISSILAKGGLFRSHYILIRETLEISLRRTKVLLFFTNLLLSFGWSQAWFGLGWFGAILKNAPYLTLTLPSQTPLVL